MKSFIKVRRELGYCNSLPAVLSKLQLTWTYKITWCYLSCLFSASHFLFPSSFPSFLSWPYCISVFTSLFFFFLLSLCSFSISSLFLLFVLFSPLSPLSPLFSFLIFCILSSSCYLYSPSIFKLRQKQIIYEGL